MTSNNVVQSHAALVDAYIQHGWSLVPVPAKTKGPRTPGWNLKENALKSAADLPAGFGVGLAHAYSGTMALDIDNWDATQTLLSQHNISLRELYDAPDAVVISSGRPGRGKLLYAMPFGLTLPSRKILHNGSVAYELRCGTASGVTVQDILPPSIHPETMKPYSWAGLGDWNRLPTVPQTILDIWSRLLDQDKTRTIPTEVAMDTSWDEIRQALEAIPADCSRDQWVSVGMALHWAGTQSNQLDTALQLWNEWSATGQEKYSGEREILAQWVSFRSDKSNAVRLGTLFHIAKDHGWSRPAIDVTQLFTNIKSDPVDPFTVIYGKQPEAPQMNVDLWPELLRRRALEVSESVGCDPMVPLFAGMAAVCGVVDARTRLELMSGFQVPPVLWLMTLGEPADKKSPGSQPMFSPLKDIEAEDRPRYTKELLDWEGKEAAYSSAKKAFLDWSASPEALLGSDQAPVVPENPPQPASLKITVSDVTSQKLIRLAADRPRGLLCHLDEMNSWIRKMTDRSSSEDRSAWVVSYESQRYEMDRVGAGNIHCENLAVSIYGNIQPAVFKQNLTALTADGLLQRFIPGVLDKTKTKLGNPMPDFMTSKSAWENLLRLTYALPAQTYKMSTEAYDEFREYQKWYEDAKRDERTLNSGTAYMTAFGKLEGLAGRLMLLFHIIETPFSPKVQVETVRRVVSLIRGYVIPAYRFTLGTAVAAVSDEHKQVIDYIIQHSVDDRVYSLDKLAGIASRWCENQPEWKVQQLVVNSMFVLEEANWAVRIENEPTRKKITWAINPNISAMFTEYRQELIKAKQRHLDYSYRHAYDKGYDKKFVVGYDPDTMD